MPSEQPLNAEVKGGLLRITVGVDRLALAFTLSGFNETFCEKSGEFVPMFSVTNKKQFAQAVCAELSRANEDGSTALERLFDEAMQRAVEHGGLGLTEVKYDK